MMTYQQLNGLLNQLKQEDMPGNPEDGSQAYAFTQLIIMGEIALSLNSLSYAYREMLKIQQSRTGNNKPLPVTSVNSNKPVTVTPATRLPAKPAKQAVKKPAQK